MQSSSLIGSARTPRVGYNDLSTAERLFCPIPRGRVGHNGLITAWYFFRAVCWRRAGVWWCFPHHPKCSASRFLATPTSSSKLRSARAVGSTTTVNSTATKPSFPQVPEDPVWDEAVTRVRETVRREQEEERREQKASSKAERRFIRNISKGREGRAKLAIEGIIGRYDERCVLDVGRWVLGILPWFSLDPCGLVLMRRLSHHGATERLFCAVSRGLPQERPNMPQCRPGFATSLPTTPRRTASASSQSCTRTNGSLSPTGKALSMPWPLRFGTFTKTSSYASAYDDLSEATSPHLTTARRQNDPFSAMDFARLLETCWEKIMSLN
jgi:hypothetical protein